MPVSEKPRKKRKNSNVVKMHKKRMDKVLRKVAGEIEDVIRKYAKFMPPEDIFKRIKILDIMYPESDAFYEQWVEVDGNVVAKVRAVEREKGRIDVIVDQTPHVGG